MDFVIVAVVILAVVVLLFVQKLHGVRMTSSLNESLDARFKEFNERVEKLEDKVAGKVDSGLKETFDRILKVQEYFSETKSSFEKLAEIGRSVNELNEIMKMPHQRGGLGEVMLDRILGDYLPQELYELQYSIDGYRVDAIIKFPDDTVLPVDSKFSKETVQGLFEDVASNVESARNELSKVIKGQAKSISKYIRPDNGTTDFALIFLPSETLYFEVIRNRQLLADIRALKVFPVSPNTFATTLFAIKSSYNNYLMAKKAKDIVSMITAARTALDKVKERLEEVGSRIEILKKSYDGLERSFNRYVDKTGKLEERDGKETESD